MSGPYKKVQSSYVIEDGWKIEDGDGDWVAVLDTELLADVVMNWLVNGNGDQPPPDFVTKKPYGKPDE